MVNFLLTHKIIVIVVGIGVAILVWLGLSSSSTPTDGSLLSTEVVDNQGVDRELVATLLALRAVKLDGSLFTDPAFMTLKDFSTQIVAEPVGRPNPFAPLGASGVSGAAPPSTSGTTTTKSTPAFIPSSQGR